MEQSNNSSIVKKHQSAITKTSSLVNRGLSLSDNLSIEIVDDINLNEVARIVDFEDQVKILKLSPSGKSLVVYFKDGKFQRRAINLSNYSESGKILQRYSGHKLSVTCLDITNNEKYMISGSHAGEIIKWNFQNGSILSRQIEKTHSWGDSGISIYGIKIFPDESKFSTISTYNNRINLHSFANLSMIDSHPGEFESVMFYSSISDNGERAITSGVNLGVYLWNLSAKNGVVFSPIDDVVSEHPVSISANGKRVAFEWLEDQAIDIIDFDSHKSLWRAHLFSPEYVFEQNWPKPDSGKTQYIKYAQGNIGEKVLLSNNTTTKNKTSHFSEFKITSFYLSDDGRICIAGTSFGDLLLLVYSEDPKIYCYHAFDSEVVATDYCSKHKLITAASKDNEIVVWSY